MDITTDYENFYSSYTTNKMLYYPVSYWFVNTNTFPISFNAISKEKGLNSVLTYLGYEQRDAVLSGNLIWFDKARKQIDLLLQQEYDKNNYKLIHIMEELKNSIKQDELFISDVMKEFLKENKITEFNSLDLLQSNTNKERLVVLFNQKLIAPITKYQRPSSIIFNISGYSKYKLLYLQQRQFELQRAFLRDVTLFKVFKGSLSSHFINMCINPNFPLSRVSPYELIVNNTLNDMDKISLYGLSIGSLMHIDKISLHGLLTGSLMHMDDTVSEISNMLLQKHIKLSKPESIVNVLDSNKMVFNKFKIAYNQVKIKTLTKQEFECIESTILTNVTKMKTLDSLKMICGAIKLDKNIDLNKLSQFISKSKESTLSNGAVLASGKIKNVILKDKNYWCDLMRNLIEEKKEIYINADFLQMQRIQGTLQLDSYMYGAVIPNKFMNINNNSPIVLNRVDKDIYLFDLGDFSKIIAHNGNIIDQILFMNATPGDATVIKSNLAAVKHQHDSDVYYKLYLVLKGTKIIYVDLNSGYLMEDQAYECIQNYNEFICSIKHFRNSEIYNTIKRTDKILHNIEKYNPFDLYDKLNGSMSVLAELDLVSKINPFICFNRLDFVDKILHNTEKYNPFDLYDKLNGSMSVLSQVDLVDKINLFVCFSRLDFVDKLTKFVTTSKSIVFTDRMRRMLYKSNMLLNNKLMKSIYKFNIDWVNKVYHDTIDVNALIWSNIILQHMIIPDSKLLVLKLPWNIQMLNGLDKLQLSKLKYIYIVDKFILDDFYRRWYFLPSDGPYDLMILPNDYPYSKNLLQGEGILQHPFPNGSDKALDEIPVDLNIMANVIDFCHELWYANCFLYSRYTPDQAVKHFVNLLFDWLDKYLPDIVNRLYEYYPDTYQIYPNPLTMMDEYWRLYKWIRWYAEAIVLNIPETDKDLLSGNVYVKKLVDDLVKYFNDHHGVYGVPGRKVFDKIKGIRHKWLENYPNKIL